MGEGAATKTAVDRSKLSRALVCSNHWSWPPQSVRSVFLRLSLAILNLLVHHQVKAGSISWKLISTREFVFSNLLLLLQSGPCVWACWLPPHNHVSRFLLKPSCFPYSRPLCLVIFLTLFKTVFFEPCFLACARVCVWANWQQQQLCFEIPPTPPSPPLPPPPPPSPPLPPLPPTPPPRSHPFLLLLECYLSKI